MPYRTVDGWTQARVTVEDRRPKVLVRGSTVQGGRAQERRLGDVLDVWCRRVSK
jgi:hypothetical protein